MASIGWHNPDGDNSHRRLPDMFCELAPKPVIADAIFTIQERPSAHDNRDSQFTAGAEDDDPCLKTALEGGQDAISHTMSHRK